MSIPGKHSKKEMEKKQLQELLNLKDKEIIDIKRECIEQFELIKNLCSSNEYNGLNDPKAKLRKINEIASDNFSALVKDLVISESEENEKGKIIELSNTRKVTNSSIKH